MTAEEFQKQFKKQLAEGNAMTPMLQEELSKTNAGLMALAMELEQSIEKGAAELQATQMELKKTNSEILQLTLELEDRVAQRTAELGTTNEHLQEKNVELANAILAKDRFLASISHELRTPLNAIIGFTGTLLMGLPGPLTTAQKKQLQIVKDSAKHQLSLINDLLDLAKIESGKVELNLEPVSCCRVLEEVAQTLRPRAEARGLKFDLQIPDDGEVILRSDRRALSQIVINLLNNAIKFTDKGAVELRVRKKDDTVEIAVTDTGIGIKPEDQAKLFQAFTRLSSGVSQRPEGTGLGLHLSQKLAELLGGRIQLESEHGVGSKFSLVIPCR